MIKWHQKEYDDTKSTYNKYGRFSLTNSFLQMTGDFAFLHDLIIQLSHWCKWRKFYFNISLDVIRKNSTDVWRFWSCTGWASCWSAIHGRSSTATTAKNRESIPFSQTDIWLNSRTWSCPDSIKRSSIKRSSLSVHNIFPVSVWHHNILGR